MSRSRGAVLFDLDDTLYPWQRFALSGFRAIALHLERTARLDRRRVFDVLRRASTGPARGLEIQACVEHFELPPASAPLLVRLMVDHRPRLRLPYSSRRALLALRPDWRLGIVTNGDPLIQARKIEALEVRPLVDAVVFAQEHGSGRGKPDREPFAYALERLQVPARKAVFVGNDEECDVSGASRAGMRTVLVRRRSGRPVPCPATAADATVDSLADVPAVVDGLIDGPRVRDDA